MSRATIAALSVVCLGLFAGCVAPRVGLTADGQRVSTNPARDFSQCRYLGQVFAHNRHARAANDVHGIRAATHELRNVAGRRGATHVVPRMGAASAAGATSMVGDAYDCEAADRIAPATPGGLKAGATGQERTPCTPDGACASGLVCKNGWCARPAE